MQGDEATTEGEQMMLMRWSAGFVIGGTGNPVSKDIASTQWTSQSTDILLNEALSSVRIHSFEFNAATILRCAHRLQRNRWWRRPGCLDIKSNPSMDRAWPAMIARMELLCATWSRTHLVHEDDVVKQFEGLIRGLVDGAGDGANPSLAKAMQQRAQIVRCSAVEACASETY